MQRLASGLLYILPLPHFAHPVCKVFQDCHGIHPSVLHCKGVGTWQMEAPWLSQRKAEPLSWLLFSYATSHKRVSLSCCCLPPELQGCLSSDVVTFCLSLQSLWAWIVVPTLCLPLLSQLKIKVSLLLSPTVSPKGPEQALVPQPLLWVSTCCFFVACTCLKTSQGDASCLDMKYSEKQQYWCPHCIFFWPTLNHKMPKSQERNLIRESFHVPLAPHVCLSFHLWSTFDQGWKYGMLFSCLWKRVFLCFVLVFWLLLGFCCHYLFVFKPAKPNPGLLNPNFCRYWRFGLRSPEQKLRCTKVHDNGRFSPASQLGWEVKSASWCS